jgi:hypothetical protein
MNLVEQVTRPLGEDSKTIPLTRGLVTVVDAADYEWLSRWKWQVTYSCGMPYVVRGSGKNKDGMIRMARAILGLTKGDRRYADHINRNTLDNRRSNLRIVTSSQNCWNSVKHRNNTSGYKGVYWHKRTGTWMVRIRVNYKRLFLGHFSSLEDAANAYREAVAKYHGEYGRA